MANNKLSITNKSASVLSASLNTWGSSDGNASFFQIETGVTETWTRHDSRGYVLYLKQGGSEEPFYVVTGSNITFVSMSNVVDNGQLIKPVSAPVPSRADVSVAK